MHQWIDLRSFQKNIKYKMFRETKKRSFIKAVGWRLIAVLNSYIVLIVYITDSPLFSALAMNITGAVLYYIYERGWNKSAHGRYGDKK